MTGRSRSPRSSGSRPFWSSVWWAAARRAHRPGPGNDPGGRPGGARGHDDPVRADRAGPGAADRYSRWVRMPNCCFWILSVALLPIGSALTAVVIAAALRPDGTTEPRARRTDRGGDVRPRCGDGVGARPADARLPGGGDRERRGHPRPGDLSIRLPVPGRCAGGGDQHGHADRARRSRGARHRGAADAAAAGRPDPRRTGGCRRPVPAASGRRRASPWRWPC